MSSFSLTCRASCTVAYSSELPGPVAQLLLELVTLLASAWRHRQTDSMSLQDTVTAWQVTVMNHCHCMTNDCHESLSLHDKRLSWITVTAWQATVMNPCHCMTSDCHESLSLHDKRLSWITVTTWQATVMNHCHYMTSDCHESLSLHDKWLSWIIWNTSVCGWVPAYWSGGETTLVNDWEGSTVESLRSGQNIWASFSISLWLVQCSQTVTNDCRITGHKDGAVVRRPHRSAPQAHSLQTPYIDQLLDSPMRKLMTNLPIRCMSAPG